MTRPNITIDRSASALLLCDIQPDFMPGGALPVAGGDQIVTPVRRLLEQDLFGLYVAVQDWHPPGHISFASSHPGRRPMDTIELYGHAQTLWPDHCVQGTLGAELHPELPIEKIAVIIRKAMDSQVDSYSAFRNNWNAENIRPTTGLAGFLREREIKDLYLCGLARDYCVKWSAEDAAAEGFRVRFFWDLTRPVDKNADAQVRADLETLGVEIITLEQLALGAAR